MLSRAAARTTTSLVSRRGFHATRARMSSPYHYPEGPYTNIPFNPRSKWFGPGYWAFMATGFLAPFGIAGASFRRLGNMVRADDANEKIQSTRPTRSSKLAIWGVGSHGRLLRK